RSREAFGEVGAGLDVVARPASVAYEGRGDEDEGARFEARGPFGENVDQDGSADGMAAEDRAVIERIELSQERRFPGRVPRVVFLRHARVAQAVVRAQPTLEALDELAIPSIVGVCASSLNKQNLHRHGRCGLARAGWVGKRRRVTAGPACAITVRHESSPAGA